MRPFQIKICGLKTKEAVDAAARAGATMAGFVFVPGSPRAVRSELATRALIQQAKAANLITVGLVAQMPAAEIRTLTEEMGLDAIQLHGNEDDGQINDTVASLDGNAQLLVAKGIRSAQDLPDPSWATGADFHLFDAKPPAGALAEGGHGQAFDWTLLSALKTTRPWLLAGGLTPQNVAEGIAAARHLSGFAGVDVSSGVEKIRGEKDLGLIRAFVEAARAAMPTP